MALWLEVVTVLDATENQEGSTPVSHPRSTPAALVPWRSYVALGDSFTEGMNDFRPNGDLRGWADRVAEAIDDARPGLRYANLAVRGAKVHDVVVDQFPAAVEMRADLASVAIGVNNMLRPRFDLQDVVLGVREIVSGLRRAGTDVLLVAFGDPRRRSKALGAIANRIREYDSHLRGLAVEFDARLVDFWGAPCFDDDRLWSCDRLHLSSLGHEHAARAGLEALGLGDGSWREPPASDWEPPGFLERRLLDAQWFALDVTPWATRNMLRRASPHQPRRPELEPLS